MPPGPYRSVVFALGWQCGDERVVLADLAGLRGATGAAQVGEELHVRVVEVLPLVRDVVLVVDGLHRAHRLAGAAVDALVGMDVEHPVALVDAVHRTLVDARLVEHIDTGLSDHVRHGGSLPGARGAVPADPSGPPAVDLRGVSMPRPRTPGRDGSPSPRRGTAGGATQASAERADLDRVSAGRM